MNSLYSTVRNKVNGALAILKFDNWLSIFIDRLFFRTPALVYSLGGRPVLIDHVGGDCGGTRDVLVSGMYEPFLSAIGPRVLRHVVDIGANGGGFALCLLLRGEPLRRLVCIEMNPNTFTRLQYNVVRNKIGVERYCINAAISAEAGYLDLRLGEGSAGDSLAHALVAAEGECFKIPAITLRQAIDSYFPDDEIDLCKIDIEGGEYSMLKGADEATFAKIRYVLIELHSTRDYCKGDGVQMILALGFRELKVECKHGDVLLFENTKLCTNG